MHTAKQITKNSFFYTGALIIQKVLSTFYFWFYSNNLRGGVEDVGRMQFVLSFVTLFFIVGDLGLYLVFLRESSKKPQEANDYFNTLLTIKLPLALLASVLILFIGYYQANFTLTIFGLLWILLDNFNMLLFAIPRSRQNMLYESIAVIGVQFITIAFGISFLFIFGDVLYLILALVIGSIADFLFILSIVIFKYKFKIQLHFNKDIARLLLKSMPAFAVAGILVKALNSIDVVLVQSLTSNYQAVGLYSIPLKLITALSLTLPTALMGSLFPAFSHLYGKSEEGLSMVFQHAVDYLLIIGLPISFGFLALGDEFIESLWKDEFIGSIAPAKIMLFAIPFIFLAFPTGNLLNAMGSQKYTAFSRGLGLGAMLVLYTLLTPKYYLTGAAVAFVATHIIILISDLYFLRSRVVAIAKHGVIQIAKVILSVLIMYVIIEHFSKFIPWYLLIMIGGFVYFAALFALKGMNLKFVKHVL